MPESASATDRRAQTRHLVTVSAQRLVDEHGVDGFTMEDLATAAGVSRRTLFNYFDSKLDAVLGTKPDLPDSLRDDFLDGGPTGDLVTDMGALAESLITAQDVTREDAQRRRRILAEPRLLVASHARLADWGEEFVALVVERDRRAGGTADPRRARIAVAVLLAILDMALDAFVADVDGRSLAALYAEILATTRSLMTTGD